MSDTNAKVASLASVVQAINTLGLELLAKGTEADANALLSPYSIQSALAMAFAGAAGDTRAEMARALHYGEDEAELHQGLAALRQAIQAVSEGIAEKASCFGLPGDPITLVIANRLFGQEDFEFREPFRALLNQVYLAPFQSLDFVRSSSAAAQQINRWVEEQTQHRIRDLIPDGALTAATRLVLVNAIYLKASWADPFPEDRTRRKAFYVRGAKAVKVPTMCHTASFGYSQRDGYQVVTVPYVGDDVQFLILLPDARDGLAKLEARLTPDLLATCASTYTDNFMLYLPKFRIEPPLLKLAEVLKSLGMKSAFDQPSGSADFDRMAPRKPGDYLFLGEVFHKTYLDLNERGTEAAAATLLNIMMGLKTHIPIEVRVDHPFLFAIQHRPSGACLFLGRVTDPRTPLS